MVATAIYSVIIITNEYYYTAIESKKTSRALKNRKKIKLATVSRRIRTGVRLSEIRRVAEEQCVEPSFEGDTSAYIRFFFFLVFFSFPLFQLLVQCDRLS